MTKSSGAKKRNILVVGNWKLNPLSQAKANELFVSIQKAINTKNATATIVACPPAIFLSGLQKLVKKARIILGAQDAFYESQGAFTGQIAIPMLKDVGVAYVIVGHSERRALGESNEVVGKKVGALLASGLTAIVCIGETARDTHGDYFTFIEAQLTAVLSQVKPAHLGRLVIAYEPVWAIGTGKHATAEDVQEMKLFIQKVIADKVSRAAVSKVAVLYGGSVNADNAATLLEEGNVDGFLVGGASLKVSEFKGIVAISDQYGR
jgi:triosephosphate isomerase (TIM)